MSSLLEQASICITPNAYKEGKLYGLKGTDLDVVRATTATRVNAEGLIESVANNVPRLDYTNGSCPSILVEPQRTNLLTYSEQFDDASWVKINTSVTANSTLSPDGTQNADTLTKSSTGVDGTIIRIVSATATGYVGSIFVKKDTNTSRFPEFFLRSSDASGENEIYVQLNTSTGATAIRLEFGTVSVSTAVLINGYWRLSFYALANSNTCRFGIRPAAGTTLGVYNANATGSIIAWGAQLEAGSNATSYIPTVASAVTRNADVISKTGIADLIGQSEGTLFIEGILTKSPTIGILIQLSDGTNNNRVQIVFDNSLFWQVNGNNLLGINGSFNFTDNSLIKMAFAYKNGDSIFYINGVEATSLGKTSVNVPLALNRVNFASNHSSNSPIFANLNSALLFKTRLSNDELATLTTL